MNNSEEILEEKVVFDEIPESSIKDFSKIKNMNLLYNVPVKLKAKLGKTLLSVEEILKLDVDCIIQLNTNVGDLVELYANDILIGYGEIVVVNEDIGVKVAQINVDEVIKNTDI